MVIISIKIDELDGTFMLSLYKISLREKCPNTEFFLVRVFLYSD